MKTVLIAVSVALATACGGSSGTTDRLANFTGSGWNASVTTTISASCPVLPGHSENRSFLGASSGFFGAAPGCAAGCGGCCAAGREGAAAAGCAGEVRGACCASGW